MARLDRIIQDQLIKMDVLDQLKRYGYTHKTNFKVKVRNGVVTLWGEAPDHPARTSAETAIWNINGVSGVENQLLVRRLPTRVD